MRGAVTGAVNARWFVRRALQGALLGLVAVFVAVVVAVATYEVPRAELDPTRGGPLVVVDRRGEVLRAVPSVGGRPGREAWVRLDDVPSAAVLTLLASEDHRFFEHHGVDPLGIARALWLDVTRRGQRYGGSTITMQLAKMLHSSGERRTLGRKLVEMRAAFGLERELSKSEILEQYLNRVYFGRGAYGIEAAAKTYFGKSARSLSVAESTALMVLPRGPSAYDPIAHPARWSARRGHLLGLLRERGLLSDTQIARARDEALQFHLSVPVFRAPHFVDTVLAELDDGVRAEGGVLTTTLDADLNARLEHRVRDYVAGLEKAEVGEAAVVVLDANRGDVLAMVGSTDYAKQRLNMATWRRHPGSALKPFVYALAVEDGAHGGTVAFDVRDVSDNFRVSGAPPERGPVRFREALAGSLNFAAIDVVERVGIERAADRLRRLGVGDLPQDGESYGPRLVLGAPKVRLLDLAAAYRAFVFSGDVRAPRLVAETASGTVPPAPLEHVYDERTAYLTMDMLSDPEARRPVFGDDLAVDLPYRVVAKTGTARGMGDTVAVLATRELLVAAWVGRIDGGAMEARQGMDTAAPLARDALLLASRGRRLTLPPRPPGLEEITVCALSGMPAGPHCTHTKHELMAVGHHAGPSCDWHAPDGTVHYPAPLRGWLKRARVVANAR